MAHGDFDTVLSPIPEDSSEEGHEYESRFSSYERIGRMICRCARHWAWEEPASPVIWSRDTTCVPLDFFMHMWATPRDISEALVREAIDYTWTQYDSTDGHHRLKLVHLDDSEGAFIMVADRRRPVWTLRQGKGKQGVGKGKGKGKDQQGKGKHGGGTRRGDGRIVPYRPY